VSAVDATAGLALDELWVTPPWLGLRDLGERRRWLDEARGVDGIERYSSYLHERVAPRERTPTAPPAGSTNTRPLVRVQTLGRFRVTRPRDGEDPVSWPRRKAMEILWLLCSSERHSVSRDEVVDRLWPDEEPEVAGLRFRVSLHALHLVLEPDRPQRAPTRVVRTTADLLWLDLTAVEIDADTFRRLAAAARQGSGRPALAAALEAVGLYEGPYLTEGADFEWTRATREELATDFRDLVLQAAQGLIAAGECGRAASLGRRLLDRDPYCEPAYRVVAAAHLAVGDRAAAERVHAECRSRLLQEVGTEPGWTLQDL
jgi:DNA-binding SARP family transcriptional activator